MDKKKSPYKIIFHPDIARIQIKQLPFEPDEGLKKLILSIHEELSINPLPDNKSKFLISEDCSCKGLLTCPLTYKGYKIRLVYEIFKEKKQVWIYAIGTVKKVDGFVEFQIKRMGL